MSTIVLTWWDWIRHLAVAFLVALWGAAGWYQAGSWDFRCGESLIAVRVRLYFWAVLIILIISLLRDFACSPFMDGLQVWVKVLVLAWGMVCFGAVALTMTLANFAQVGCQRGKSRYVFSHVVSIALFLVLMSSRLSPSSLIGW